MDDPISRQAAIDTVHKVIFNFFDLAEDDDESPMTYLDEKLLEVNKALTNELKELHAAQSEMVQTVEPVRRGKWIVSPREEWETFDECICSVCNTVEYFNVGWKRFNYCPNCGARMENEKETNHDHEKKA